MKNTDRWTLILVSLMIFGLSAYSQSIIKMKKHDHGTFELPIEINDVLKINFIFDPGASEVSISPDVALTLIKTGTVSNADWLPSMRYQFADGSTARSRRFKIKKLNIGGHYIYDVETSIENNLNAPLLLGQSALSKLGRLQIDYDKNTLTILTTASDLSSTLEHPKAKEIQPAIDTSWKVRTAFPSTERRPSENKLADLILGSEEIKQFLDGGYFEIGYQRTNFANQKIYGISQDYGEGFQFSMGYTLLPLIMRLDGYSEEIETVPEYSDGYKIGDRKLVHNGLNLSASLALFPSLKYGFPYVGLAQQIVVSKGLSNEAEVASTSPFWLGGIQINLNQFYLGSNMLGGFVFAAEYRQSIGDAVRRRSDLTLMIGIRMRPTE